ncbi:oxidoreductase molybdopterin binding [Hymenobacter roseosalivarius DSM 11622]|uniref:Oxidoreductase molybdopterin binding n=1 Tax=Hymenobacter roseosalivarius DSM 11622 TaxID=645990 RepID=A0A1W1VZ16_9BACT|nr:molybdopterin-dependent oxidoreductase [Hymenobacter roseosalivarius]SMB98605.1 oxidoreductase molybdopterin binding [Hymenobacter roseosalivarius DSM 11622]
MNNSVKMPPSAGKAAVEQEIRRRSRRSFLLAGAAALAGLGGWRWLISRPTEAGVPWPLRRVLEANRQLSAEYFSHAHLAPVFANQRARMPRTNGSAGMQSALDPAAWRLRVRGFAPQGSPASSQEFTLADIQALPKVEMVTELKCIEGWSTIVHWGGARLADFVARYPLATRSGTLSQSAEKNDLASYVGLATPDGGYYVGLDMASALHPQTLLCYEMNGQPLTEKHGAPLRLVLPVKYGIKYLKRIGTIAFTNQRPADYWAERGYDWDAGH